MNFRKACVVLILMLVCVHIPVFSQQITKFAVVDTTKIYTTFYRDSRNVRDYEAKKNQYQGEIERMAEEIKKIRQEKVDSESQGDQSKQLRFQSEIESKTNILLEYSKAKNAELDTLKKKLITDDQFYSMLYSEIQKVAESDGYSMVLSLQEGTSIIWYSPTVDITEKIIRNLVSKQ